MLCWMGMEKFEVNEKDVANQIKDLPLPTISTKFWVDYENEWIYSGSLANMLVHFFQASFN